MSSLVGSMQKMKAQEEKDRSLKVACDILRTLVVLGGTGWEDEMLDNLAALAAAQSHLELVASSQEVEDAVNLLKEKGLIEYRRGKKADAAGTSIIDENLYALTDYTAALQVFGSDKPVMILRRGE